MKTDKNTFSNYIGIRAEYDSTASCGHPIKKGNLIGYNTIVKRTQCADCWSRWQREQGNL